MTATDMHDRVEGFDALRPEGKGSGRRRESLKRIVRFLDRVHHLIRVSAESEFRRAGQLAIRDRQTHDRAPGASFDKPTPLWAIS